MYFETKTLANHFDRLVLRVQNLRNSIDDLMDPKTNRGIAQTMQNSSDLVYNITRRVDEWIKADELAKLCRQLEGYLDRETFEGYLTYDLADQWWDDKGKEMLAAIFSTNMRTIIRGFDGSREPMTRMVEEMAVKAAQRVLEYVCGISEYDLYSEKVGRFILDGADAERTANEESRRKVMETTVTTMDLFHSISVGWFVLLRNTFGDSIGESQLKTQSIMEARVLVKALRNSTTAEQANGKTIVIKEHDKNGMFAKNL